MIEQELIDLFLKGINNSLQSLAVKHNISSRDVGSVKFDVKLRKVDADTFHIKFTKDDVETLYVWDLTDRVKRAKDLEHIQGLIAYDVLKEWI